MSFEPDAVISRSDRSLDALVCGFGLWTVCAHAAVYFGAGLHALMIGFAITALAVVAVVVRFPARDAREEPGEDENPDAVESSPPVWLRVAVASGAAGCTAAVAWGAPLEWVWVGGVAVVGTAAVRELLSTAPRFVPPEVRRIHVAVLAALAIVCVGVTLASHRPDADDGFYLNLAVAAADDPDAPVLASDTLHRESGVPLPLPIYRIHSLELLQAVLARVSGRPVLDIAHLLFPALAALLVPLVWARLARRLLPRSWLWATAFAIGVLLFGAAASHGWSNFGLVRLHQGKALLLTLSLPLTLAYALEFARTGGAASWLRLAAIQIGAAGLSASGLWLAPAVAAPALLAGARDLRGGAGWRRIGIGLTASAYVVVIAVALRGATVAAFQHAAVPSPELAFTNLELFRQALRTVIGPGLTGMLAFFAALGAWAFAPNAVSRRVCALSAAATLLIWNPFLASTVATALTSAPTYWRVLWLLPMPILIGVVLVSPIELIGASRPQPSGVSKAIAGLLATLICGAAVLHHPRAFAPSAANQVAFRWPSWKVPPTEFDAASAISAAATPADRVLAPQHVAPWIPTIHHYPAPLVVRAEYLPVLHAKLGDDELRRRMQLMRLVSGRIRPPLAVELLRRAIEDDRLAVVCVSKSATRWPDVMAVLPEMGFQRIHANADYEVWESPK